MTHGLEGAVTPQACPSARALVAAVRGGETTARANVEAALERVAANETLIGAFEVLEKSWALEAAALQDRGGARGLLAGVPIGVKDVMDTADLPTANGCRHLKDRRPVADATVVTRLRKAGAIVLGKTVTTECAYYTPGKTRNPYDLARTPGGSSSGSAAAVAAGMVPLALGTQTAGSIIRPAAFCGVWGLKPSHGLIPRTGVLMLSHTLDHVGAFAATIEDVARAIDLMAGEDGEDLASASQRPSRLEAALGLPLDRPRLGFAPSFAWPEMEGGAAARFEALAKSLGAEPIDMGPLFADSFRVHRTIMACEMAHHLWPIYREGGMAVSEPLRAFLVEGRGIDAEAYLEALDRRVLMRAEADRLFSRFDAVITPAAPGEAPFGLGHTGSRLFCLLWSLLGVPAINVPGLKGDAGLPLGVQVVGRYGSDAETLRASAWIGRALAETAA